MAAYMVVEKTLSRTNDIINTTEIRIPTYYVWQNGQISIHFLCKKLEFVEIYMALPLCKFMPILPFFTH